MTDGEPETAVSASLQKIKSIKNQHKHFSLSIFYLIKFQTSDSFVNHFDGHFAYLKTLDFSFNNSNISYTVLAVIWLYESIYRQAQATLPTPVVNKISHVCTFHLKDLKDCSFNFYLIFFMI